MSQLVSLAPLRISDGSNSIELRVLEHGQPPGMEEGDLRIGVSVCFDGVSGSYDHVWIAAAEWRHFIGALEQVERERKGEASLASVSPGEFELHLRTTNARGDAAAYGRLSRYHFLPSAPTVRSSVAYYVEVDPSALGVLVDSFHALGERET